MQSATVYRSQPCNDISENETSGIWDGNLSLEGIFYPCHF